MSLYFEVQVESWLQGLLVQNVFLLSSCSVVISPCGSASHSPQAEAGLDKS